MKEQLATFRSQLDEFARKHKVFISVKTNERGHGMIVKDVISMGNGCDDYVVMYYSHPVLEFSQILGTVFEVISIGRRNLVRSVPTELNKDHNEILELPQVQGFVTVIETLKISSSSIGSDI
ncbi:hypothetical protein SADUNF_Sadunf11G0100500 [Salix dunnii]|uniref:Uncharacterized protein n=1 Tax=Salix dunnii TaxID=1413687 RepID=A0A835JQY2_9ROSI|nr:hypothetical protein SADUNF_Sadunf11G0100500 [Salix dunnii]